MNTRSLTHDFSTWERGHRFTAEELLALYESDEIAKFAIDGMIEDATNHWIKNFVEPNPDAPIADKIIQAMKWADLYGDSIVVLLDAATEEGQITDASLLASLFSGSAAGCDVFHPLVDGDGYEDPSTADLDALGNPKVFRVHVKGVLKPIEIHPSRCVVFSGRKTRRGWRGLCEFAASIDDVVDYRKWRAAYGIRATKIAVPHAHWNKAENGSDWSSAELANLDLVEGEGQYVQTTGKVTREIISGNLTVGELDAEATSLLQAIANDLGVSLNDIFQHQGNAEKFAPDSNQTTYILALMSRQKRHEMPVKKVLTAFGIKFEGWNSPWEEAMQTQITNINGLAKTYNESADPEIKSIVKSMLVTQYGEKTNYKQYLTDERGNAARDAEITRRSIDAFRGITRETGSA
jgi:hypothetical protein